MPKQQLRQWYKVVTAKAGDDAAPASAEILIYDAIDSWFGVSAQELVNELKALEVDSIDVRINSPGGSAFDGIAIFNALKRHPAHVTTYNDGLAASAASLIAQAGDTKITSKYAETMVHGAAAVAMGKADELRAVADQMDRLNGNMAQLYADSCGGTADEWAAIMEAETWYTGAEAVKAGLFDKVDKTAETTKKGAAAAAASADGREFDLSGFKYAGRSAAPAPFGKDTMPTKKTGVAAAVAASLGPDPDDDPNALLASLDAVLDEAAELVGPIDRASVSPEVGQVLDLVVAAEALVDQLMELVGVYDPDDDEGGEPTASGASSPITKATASTKGTSMATDDKGGGGTGDGTGDGPAPKITLTAGSGGGGGAGGRVTTPPVPQAKAGTVVVDAAQFAALQEQARLGAAAHNTLQAQADARVVDAAIDKGKIPPSRRDHYMGLMSADRDGTTTLLNETLEESAIPLHEIGHSAAGSDSGPQASANLDNPLYKDWMVS